MSLVQSESQALQEDLWIRLPLLSDQQVSHNNGHKIALLSFLIGLLFVVWALCKIPSIIRWMRAGYVFDGWRIWKTHSIQMTANDNLLPPRVRSVISSQHRTGVGNYVSQMFEGRDVSQFIPLKQTMTISSIESSSIHCRGLSDEEDVNGGQRLEKELKTKYENEQIALQREQEIERDLNKMDYVGDRMEKRPKPVIVPTPLRQAFSRYFYVKYLGRSLPPKIPFSKSLNLTVAQAGVIIVYLLLITGFLIYTIGFNWLGNNTGPAYIAVSQVPIVLLLALKNSVISIFLGKSYDRVTFLHQTVGFVIFGLASVHVGLVVFVKGFNLSGCICAVALGVLMAISLPLIRRKFSQLFIYIHLIGWLMFVVGLAIHAPHVRNYIWTMVAFYAFDLALRASKTRKTNVTISSLSSATLTARYDLRSPSPLNMNRESMSTLNTQATDDPTLVNLDLTQESTLINHDFNEYVPPFPIIQGNLEFVDTNEEKMVLVECSKLTSGWSAGQHVWMRVLPGMKGSHLAGAMKWRCIENHPVRIASASSRYSPLETPSLRLLIRDKGGWSKSLHDACTTFNKDLTVDSHNRPATDIQVLFDGPYGGLGYETFSTFQSVLLLTENNGISFGLGMLDELIGKSIQGFSLTRLVTFVWVTPKIEDLDWCKHTLTELFNVASKKTELQVNIYCYITQGTQPTNSVELVPFPGCKLFYDKPDIPSLLDVTVKTTNKEVLQERAARGGGVAVGVCGSGLEHQAHTAVTKIEKGECLRAGGLVYFCDKE